MGCVKLSYPKGPLSDCLVVPEANRDRYTHFIIETDPLRTRDQMH